MAKREAKPKISILGTVRRTAAGLHRAGVIDEAELREFDDLCLMGDQIREATPRPSKR